MNTVVPIAVQIRMILEKAGFVFVDSGLCAFAVNKEPKCIGKIKATFDCALRQTTYKQEYNKEEYDRRRNHSKKKTP